MSYRANVTDKQQADLENALNCSAIRIQWFDGKAQQTGETKFIRAYDLNGQGNVGAGVTSAMRQFSSSGLCIGCHNDKPAVFEHPGKV